MKFRFGQRFHRAMVGAVLASGALTARVANGASCESLSTLKLPHRTITLAQTVSGSFTPSGSEELKDIPVFCRVTAESKPSDDSQIEIEVWMPASGWNGKYQGQGNGGFAGSIDYDAMAGAVSRGYATASTDTGHRGIGTDANWALAHPEKVVDFGYRAIHEMTETAKAVIKAFYGEAPRRAYFASCSNGGRQALMEAQRFPEDYDGIIAGAPANFWTHLLTEAAFNARVTLKDPASYIPPSKIPAISSAVLAACDAQDGIKDGVLNDPRQCHFDPGTMLCKGADSDSCLSAPQAAALQKIYAGPRTSNGQQTMPGYEPGGEEGRGGWGLWITGDAPGRALLVTFGINYFADMVYENATWDFRTFDLDRDVRAADDKTARILNATDPNLKPFESRGGKLIMYHGWSDAAIPPVNAINYYENVIGAMGPAETGSFLRLFMVPGMQHCSGGPGPVSFDQFGSGKTAGDPDHDMFTALERWVERGIAPKKIIGSGDKMTRPLCPYPQIAKYKGAGDTNDAANFVCASN
ncbi:MAG: tannase/feruloyl esterase family alpha/beta hydrolase [Bryobacteraceae bacterium]